MLTRLRKWLQRRKNAKEWNGFIKSIDFPKNPGAGQHFMIGNDDGEWRFTYNGKKWNLTGRTVKILPRQDYFKIDSFKITINDK